jgi:hypothetical protein
MKETADVHEEMQGDTIFLEQCVVTGILLDQ